MDVLFGHEEVQQIWKDADYSKQCHLKCAAEYQAAHSKHAESQAVANKILPLLKLQSGSGWTVLSTPRLMLSCAAIVSSWCPLSGSTLDSQYLCMMTACCWSITLTFRLDMGNNLVAIDFIQTWSSLWTVLEFLKRFHSPSTVSCSSQYRNTSCATKSPYWLPVTNLYTQKAPRRLWLIGATVTLNLCILLHFAILHANSSITSTFKPRTISATNFHCSCD